MSETLLDKAKANLKCARILLTHSSTDEQELCIVAYHLQQCVETALKHVLYREGLKVPYTRSITALTQCAMYDCQSGLSEHVFELLERKSGMLTDWAVKTRYVLGYKVFLKAIEEVIVICDKLIAEIENLAEQAPTTNEFN